MSDGVVLVTAGYDHTIRFWTASQGICHRTLQHPESQVNALAITPDKLFVAAAGNPHIRLFEIETQNPAAVTSYEAHSASVTAVGFQDEALWFYSSSEDATVKIWDLKAAGCQRNYTFDSPISSCALHPNQVQLIIGDHLGRVRVLDLRASKCIEEVLPEKDSAIQSVAVASNGKFIVAGNNKGKVFIWHSNPQGPDTLKNSPMQKVVAHDGYVLKCAISPDCTMLATTSSDRQPLKLWSTGTFETTGALQGHSKWVWDCAFSSDSMYLVSVSSDTTARLWDIGQREAVRQFNGHSKAVNIDLNRLSNKQ